MAEQQEIPITSLAKPRIIGRQCVCKRIVCIVSHCFCHLVTCNHNCMDFQQKAYSTEYSQAVTHPSTNSAQCCLTSVIGRELVYSTWYGRRHLIQLTLAILKQKICLNNFWLVACNQTFWWNIFLANRRGLVICFHSQSIQQKRKVSTAFKQDKCHENIVWAHSICTT